MNHKVWAFPRLRTVRLFLAAAGAVLALSASAQVRTVETPVATLRLSEATGDLIGLRWKSPDMEVIGEARLGENFRILIPEDNYQGNYFNSQDQTVSGIQLACARAVREATRRFKHSDQRTLPVGATIEHSGDPGGFVHDTRWAGDTLMLAAGFRAGGGQQSC